jgi:hypothetical protein
LYTSCVLGLRPFALFNEFLLIKKKKSDHRVLVTKKEFGISYECFAVSLFSIMHLILQIDQYLYHEPYT